MRFAPLLVTAVLCACGGAQHDPETLPRAAPESGCRFAGIVHYGPLLHLGEGYPVARGHDLPAEVILTHGPLLRVAVLAEGFALDAALPLELDVVGPTRLGGLLYVAPQHDVSVTGVGPDGVRVGPPPFLDESLRLNASAEIWVQCEDLALRGIEMSDPDADLQALGFVARGEREIPAGVALELREEPGGPVLGTLAPTERPRRVTLLEEASGAARIAIDHWQDVLIIGWTDAGSLQAVTGDEGMAGLLGALATPRAYDITVCTAPGQLELLVQQIATVADDGTPTPLGTPASPTPLGAILEGTRVVRIADREDGLVQVAPHPSATLTVPLEAAWLVRREDLGTACTSEHIDAPPLSSIFGPG